MPSTLMKPLTIPPEILTLKNAKLPEKLLLSIYAADPATGPADALRGAREMLQRLEQLNYRLRGDLREPLRIGIGIHYGEAIVGAMGPPRSQIVTAIGDTVNTCARLEA